MRWMPLFLGTLCVVGAYLAATLVVGVAGDAARAGGSIALGAKAQAEAVPSLAGAPRAVDAVQPERARRAAEARRRWLASPAARARRTASRMAFHGLGPAASRGLLARDFGPELRAAAVNLADAGVIAGRGVRYLSPFKALIRGPHGPRFVYSSAPLLAGRPGRLRPVDLRLGATAAGFAPRNPVRGVSIARRLSGGVGLWSPGLRVYPAGKDVVGGEMAGQRVLFAGAALDTDVGVEPTLGGVELFAVLRSRMSPEELSYRFELPSGEFLRATGARVVVARGQQVLATISPPSATDAQGKGVPVSMSVVGNQLVLGIPHRAHDVAYPVYVDPYISEEEGAPGWSYHEGKANGNKFIEEPEPFVPIKFGGIEAPTGPIYPSGATGRWVWHTPGGEAITEVVYSDVEQYFPHYNPNEEHLYGQIDVWCGSAIANVQFGEGFFFTLPPTPGYGCAAEPDEVQINYATTTGGLTPKDTGQLFFNFLFIAEGVVPASDRYGPSNPGEPNMPHTTCGDPVDCASGNGFEVQKDMTVPGRGAGLSLVRTYNSQLAAKVTSPGTFGYGWSSSYNTHLAVNVEGGKGTATVYEDNGSTILFEQSTNGWIANGPWVQAKLVETEGEYVYALPDQITMRFDKEGRLLSEADRDGNTITLSYNEAGQLEKAEDAEGRAIVFSYNEEGFIKEAKGPAGAVSYAYTSGNLTQVTDLDKHEWKLKYDGSHQLTSLTDPLEHTSTTEYDALNRVTSQTDARKHTRTWKYAQIKAGTETIVTDPKGTVNVEQFNSAGLLTSITRASGTSVAATTTYEYDSGYNLISMTDPNGHITKYEYNATGDRTRKTSALEHKTEWTYDFTHDITSITDPLGNITKIGYTETGDPATVTRTLSKTGEEQVISYGHNDTTHPGDITTITDPTNHQTKLSYGPYGNVVKIADPLGHTTSYEYDAAGRPTAAVSPLGNVAGGKAAAYTTKYTYDSLGRLLSVTDPMGDKTSYEYNADGYRNRITNPSGNKTVYTYDTDNNLEKTERADGTKLTQTYDADNILLTQTNGGGSTITYTYNALGHLESAADPDKHKTAYVFDGQGNLISKTDPQGRKTKYSYDADNRLTGVAYSDGKTPNVALEYNSDNERIAMKDGIGGSAYEYDSLGRLLNATDGNGNQISYGYDLANHLTGITYPGKHTVTSEYDGDGRVTAVEDWKSNKTTIQYDANNNLAAATLPKNTGVVDTATYDADNNPMSIVDQRKAIKLASYLYTRDNNERLTSTTTSQISEAPQTYAYTSLGQLKLAGPKPVQDKYAYNTAEDITSLGSKSILTYDPADELCWQQAKILTGPSCVSLPTGATGYTYDQDGNRTSQGKGATLVSYTYDQADRLVKYNGKATYAYNGDGMRLSATTAKGTEHYVWDNSSPAPHLLEDATNKYIYGPDGTPLEQISNSGETVTYLHHDQLGNTRLLTNTSGENVGTYSYTPYGTPTHTGSATTPLQYTGQYTDPESGLVYLHARYYDPTTAQFITRDPYTASTGEPYAYASDDPINETDPTGFGFLDDVGSFINSAVNPIPYYEEEIEAIENGCSYWDSVSHGIQGALVAASDIPVGDVTTPTIEEHIASLDP
jgi:RHS repeat-associated protein